MKIIKKVTSFLIITCLTITFMGFQTVHAEAFLSDGNNIDVEMSSHDKLFREETDDADTALTSTESLSTKDKVETNFSTGESKLQVAEQDDGELKLPDKKTIEGDEMPLLINSAFVNGNILTLNFNKILDANKLPLPKDFKVKMIYNNPKKTEDIKNIDPVYQKPSNPAYTISGNTTIYPISADETAITEIDIFNNKAILTLGEAVTPNTAVTLDYTANQTGSLLCDESGNSAEDFSDYGIANYTGGSNVPDFVAEEICDELDTSAISEQLSRQIYYGMTGYIGTRQELLDATNEIIRILSSSNMTYEELSDENKLKVCDFFGVSDEFFRYSGQQGENIEAALLTYSDMISYGLTEEEIKEAIQQGTRDEVLDEKAQETVDSLYEKRFRRAALTASGDDFSEVKYNPEKLLSAPFKHNEGANEQINLSSGTLDYNVTDVILPGAGGMDLDITRQYSTDQANYYNINGKIQYGTNKKGKPIYSTMKVYEREKQFAKNPDGTMGNCIETKKYKPQGDDEVIDSDALRGLYSQQKIKADGDSYSAYIYKIAMTSATTNTISGKQVSNPSTVNDKIWGLGTGWKFNFSYIDKDTFYYDYMKLHLSDGRTFCISPNWVNNLGHYTYKDVIFANEAKEVRGQKSAHSVTYADGKKEYFNGDGKLIAIVDRFGNTISFVYATINNMTDVNITDSLGRVTAITNKTSGAGYDKVLTMPDGQTITYTVNRNKARELDKMRGYEKYPGQFNEYNLSQVTNPAGEVTTYNYTDILCGADFGARFKLSDRNKFMGVDSFGDDDKYYPNYYAGLSKITYPTGLTVNYEYYPRSNAWHDYGCIMDIAIKSRFDSQNGKEYNRKEYEYSYQYKKNGQLRDALYNADGYSKELPDKDPFEIWNDWYVKEKDVSRNITKEYGFDYHRGYCTYEKVYDAGVKLVQSTSNTYNVYNQLVHPSKTKITTERYDTSNKQAFKNIECYAYDDKGNAVSYWPSLSEGNTGDAEYKVSLTYDSQYNYVTGKSYKRDAATVISEQNLPSADKKTVAQSLVYENGQLKAKSDFAYDSYGNVIQSNRYTDVAAGTFIGTGNTYKDGAYLTGITVQNVTDADGKNLGSISRQATHDIYGRILTETDGNGNVTHYTYDKSGRVTKVQYPDNSTKIYVYNTPANITTETDELGQVTRYQYDPAGNLTGVYRVEGGKEILLKANEYDSAYRIAKEQNDLAAGGSVTTYGYDNKDRIILKRSADQTNKTLAQESTAYYDDKIIKTVEGGADCSSLQTTEYNDKYGRVTKKGQIINGTEVFHTFEYNYLGQAVKEKSARANTENYSEHFTARNEYDHAGNVIRQYDVNGNCVTTGYDAAGRKTAVTDARSNAAGGTYKTLYTYDALGRLAKEETPFTETSMAVTKYYYDANGNLIRKQIKNNLPGAEEASTKIENVYNNKNKLTQVKNYNGSALANQVEYTYDVAGNLTAMKTAQGAQLTKYEYDQYGHLTVLTDPLGKKETYIYDINGNMTSKTDKNGVVTRYAYDGLSRKLSQSVTKNEATQSETMGYTQTGALAFTQNENLRTDYIYDDQGRKVKETDSNGVEKVYTYDTAGNVKTSVVKVNGTSKKELAYTYDKKDRLIQVYEAGMLVATYSYDANGNRNSLSYGNGDSSAYTYNLANMVTSLNNKKGSDVLSSYDYTYYLDGNQATKRDNKGRQTSYSYDGLGRLTKEAESGVSDAITKTYTFDRANNRSAMAVSGAEAYIVGYTYDLNNRLTEETKQAGGKKDITDYQYDANGNTISKKTETVNEGAERQLASNEAYTYDGFDRMTAVKNDVGDIAYAYKPDGLRISKTVNGIKTTQVWEGQDIALELDGSNAVTNRYIRGNGLIKSDQNGWYLFNTHGDVVQLADGAGNVTKGYVYDAFGNEKNIDSNDSNPFRYCGEYFDKETGDIYLRARYYDPEIGRFISEDSFTGDVNDPLSLNLYTYCRNNPILYIDPSGNKYIFDDVWHGMVYRADTMRDNPSAYNVGNWLSMGFFDTVNGAVNPEKPLSMQHWIDSAAVVTTFAGGYGAYKSAVPRTSVTTTAGKTVVSGAGKTGANNIANMPKLNVKLTYEEASSIFTNSGTLRAEVIKNSNKIMPGSKLNSSNVIKALTRDGSSINDWAKMSTRTFKSPSGSFQVHFYQNVKTGQISTYEMKVKFNK
ncbi:RHS repeat-associated core domain-containing protein [Aminipila butyrica]|uniref:RHS repeat-associated core domain-containing protein n=1 Tax=Aminipila butyrica TaxID=433296 RepID=A0A858C029_9FIRM|nr:RHS repeat-associated core domain-containing protein [Aminipila butyrica]QIB70560.1 RHS repeat-associated core domain-containing protein [Aminipila butyrica]